MSNDYVIKSDGFPHKTADPNSKKLYGWDWTNWLAQQGATSILSAVITVDTGLTLVGVAGVAGGLVTQVIQVAGAAGSSLKAVCRVTTTSGIIDDRTIVLDVAEM